MLVLKLCCIFEKKSKNGNGVAIKPFFYEIFLFVLLVNTIFSHKRAMM